MPALVGWFMLCLLFGAKESEFVFQAPGKCQNLPDLLESSHQGVAHIFLHHTSSPELLPVLSGPPPNTNKFSTTDQLSPLKPGNRDL